jgi:cellobiose phosphorylase
VAAPGTSRPGEAKNSWLTGTASWSHVAVTQYILGIRASLDGLVVDPRIPADWPSFHARRVYRGATYEIEVVNARGTSRGPVGLTVDGKPVLGRTVPLAEPGATVRVKLVLG